MKVLLGPRVERVEIHPRDVWSLDHTLAKIILPSLKLFKEKKCGTPISCIDEVMADTSKNFNTKSGDYAYEYERGQGIFDFYKEVKSDEVISEEAAKLFDESIDKMIYSFEALLDENKYFSFTSKEDFVKIQEGFDLFGKYYLNLWH